MTVPIKSVRGTRDIRPPAIAIWQFVEDACRQVFGRYGFLEIRTPIFELSDLYFKGVGIETDIVNKEMYSWQDGKSPISILEKQWLVEYRNNYDEHLSYRVF